MAATVNGKAPKPHKPSTLLGELGIPLPGEEAAAEALNEAAPPSAQNLIEKGVTATGEAVASPVVGFFEKLLKKAFLGTVDVLLLIAGMLLFVYGIAVAVRPRESAFGVPTPRVVPIPV